MLLQSMLNVKYSMLNHKTSNTFEMTQGIIFNFPLPTLPPFRHHLQSQVMRKCDGGNADGRIVFIFFDAADEDAIEFQRLDRE